MKPFDIQINGYAGVDFCSDSLNERQLQHACEALTTDGVDSILATLITDSMDSLCKKLGRFVRLREDNSVAERMITGFHLEGPFLNSAPGYIGAHSAEFVRPANVEDAKRLLDASGGLIKLVTLAPECDKRCETIRFFADQKITVSAGHCNPSRDQLQAAIDNGLCMVTHFGNGCPVELPRHDNFLNRALSLRDQLWFCFIPDGHHVEFYALGNYLQFVGIERTIMVTDAISAATLGPGRHEISGMEVEVDGNGVARKPGFQNLAGSTITMPRVQANLKKHFGLSESEIELVVDINPRKALGMN